MPNYRFEPRERPWYQAAADAVGLQLTPPYVFFTTRQVGLTLSQRGRDAKYVVGIDLALSDLGNEMQALKPTPRSRIAVIDQELRVIAFTEPERNLKIEGDLLSFRTTSELGDEALANLGARGMATKQAVSFSSAGERWFGISMPFDVIPGSSYRILVIIPESDLLVQMREATQRQILFGVGLASFLLPMGWWAGREIGRTISRLTIRGRQFTRFRFDGSGAAKPSRLKEVRELDAVLAHMGTTVRSFLSITRTIGREPEMDTMLSKVLESLVSATHCQQGGVYLLSPDGANLDLVASNRPLAATDRKGAVSAPLLPSKLALDDALAWANDANQSVGPAHSTFGEQTQWLALKLNNRQEELIGLLALEFDDDPEHSGDDFRTFVAQLSGALEVSIETRMSLQAQRRLFDSVVQLLADAIDAKSPYTGGHCERVPELAEMILERFNNEPSSPYRGRWSSEQKYEFHLGAWLHDAGKITSPEHVIDKATKLETIYNRIHEVRMRFEVLHRDAQIAYWQGIAEGANANALLEQMQTRHRQLQDDFELVAQCNVGGEALADATIERLRRIGAQRWSRHFNDRVGLSADESRRMEDVPNHALPVQEQVLADRPEHIVAWSKARPPVERNNPSNVWGFDMKLPTHERNLGELHNLSIRRGTLTDEDRFRINDHIVQTLIMLRSLPWPRNLARVPDIAATHHEKLDGTGYPRRLAAGQLTIEDRIMAVADIFEALTAADRPYKPPKTLSESLRIMAFMARDQHICPAVFTSFLRKRIWLEFAQRHLRPEQIDEVDLEGLIELIGPVQST